MAEDVNEVLRMVPQRVQDGGSKRDQLEALFVAMAAHRNGQQARFASLVAAEWNNRREPKLNCDDPKQATERLRKCLDGTCSMDVDLVDVFVQCLPETYRLAYRAMTGEAVGVGVNASLCVTEAQHQDRRYDVHTDALVHEVNAAGGPKDCSTELLQQLVMAHEDEMSVKHYAIEAAKAELQRRRADAGRSA